MRSKAAGLRRLTYIDKKEVELDNELIGIIESYNKLHYKSDVSTIPEGSKGTIDTCSETGISNEN